MKHSIIGNGLIGNVLSEKLADFVLYDRHKFNNFDQVNHDVVIVSAPTSNRLHVSANPDSDLADCQQLYKILEKSTYNRLIHISTVDIYPTKSSSCHLPEHCPTTGYGHNRWILERMISSLPNSQVMRLPTLCHPAIKKNLLFDLKNRQWLDKINPKTSVQWYVLDRLDLDIKTMLASGLKYENFVSAPIPNQNIITRFASSLIDLARCPKEGAVEYDIRSSNGEYNIDLTEIWQGVADYFS